MQEERLRRSNGYRTGKVAKLTTLENMVTQNCICLGQILKKYMRKKVSKLINRE